MWTPRRIFLGLFGLLTFAACYFGYGRILGRYDGLPPLPAEFKNVPGPPLPVEKPRPTQMIRRFEQAFGEACPELRWNIRTDSNEKGVLLATQTFVIEPSGPRKGWVKVFPLSMAVYGKKLGADGTPEINTLYADIAWLEFDKPVKAATELSGRRIMRVELHADQEAVLGDDRRKGRVRVQNNRRTVDPNDDIELITSGPVYYDEEPEVGRPSIYTFDEVQVQVWDHLNTGQSVPDRSESRPPTVSGNGMRIYLTPKPKEPKGAKAPKKAAAKGKEPRLPIPRKDPKAGVSGVDLIELTAKVEMNVWTSANASFIAPGNEPKEPEKPKPLPPEAKADPKDPKKDPAPKEKRLLQIKTNGPFRYDLTRELAHFERPADGRPGRDQYVEVSRAGRVSGQDMLICDYMDVQFQRKKVPPLPKGAAPPPENKDAPPPEAGDADLEIKSIRAWGEQVVITSDSDSLHASGVELTHEAEAKMTVLKGNAQKPMHAVQDGHSIRGGELHLFGDGKEISQAHVLGAGSIGMGELDPKTGEFLKQATWTDRFVFNRYPGGNGVPPLDVITLLGKDGGKATYKDTSEGSVRQIEAHQLKLDLRPTERDKDGKQPARKKDSSKDDLTRSARPVRLQATGEVKSTSPDVVIQHTEYLDVVFQEVQQLVKPPDPKADAKAGPKVGPPDPKSQPPKTEPKKEPAQDRKPLVVTARTIKTWVNRDPKGKSEIDRVEARGKVEAHQDPANKDDQGTDIAGEVVEVQAFPEGSRLVVVGDSADRKNPKWGVVRVDQLTIFGFNIVIDQRDSTSNVRGEGSMEILSSTNMEGRKLEKPSKMTIYWKHKMDFLGPEKLIYYHGGVQAYQEASKLKCEWMQVALDRPVFLNQERRPKRGPAKVGPDGKKEDTNPKIDTVMCFHAPRDEDVPKPKTSQPVTIIEQVEVDGKIVRFQSIQASDVAMVNTPLENGKARHDITATSPETAPGVVRLFQVGPKDMDGPEPKAGGPKKDRAPRKKGELGADQEMKLTVVQFGGKMIANDLRKRAKFFTNIRAIHLPADSPTLPVDLREGDIPKGAVYLECRDTLDVFATTQRERDPNTGKEIDVSYQEMVAVGNVRVRKQGEFFGDADRVTYSELKGTLTFHGTDRNPAVVYEEKGQGIEAKPLKARTITYFTKTKTFSSEGTTGLGR